jgi:hypothetical protein
LLSRKGSCGPPSDFRFPTSNLGLPPSAFRLPTSAFRLPTSAFLLPTSAFRLPPSAFRLPPSALLAIFLLSPARTASYNDPVEISGISGDTLPFSRLPRPARPGGSGSRYQNRTSLWGGLARLEHVCWGWLPARGQRERRRRRCRRSLWSAVNSRRFHTSRSDDGKLST